MNRFIPLCTICGFKAYHKSRIARHLSRHGSRGVKAKEAKKKKKHKKYNPAETYVHVVKPLYLPDQYDFDQRYYDRKV